MPCIGFKAPPPGMITPIAEIEHLPRGTYVNDFRKSSWTCRYSSGFSREAE